MEPTDTPPEGAPPSTYRLTDIADDAERSQILYWGGSSLLPVEVARAIDAGDQPGDRYRIVHSAVTGGGALIQWVGGFATVPTEVADEIVTRARKA